MRGYFRNYTVTERGSDSVQYKTSSHVQQNILQKEIHLRYQNIPYNAL